MVGRVDEHVQRDVLLKGFSQHKINKLLDGGFMLGPAQNADEFDLAEAGLIAHHRRRRRFVDGRVGKVNLGRRAAGIANHNRPVPVGGGGELAPVSIFPAVGDQDAIINHLLPEVKILILAKMANRGQQKSQAGSRRGRVFDHGQVGISGIGQIFECRRRFKIVILKPGFVVVQADIPVINRQGAILWV